jgi:hypothetical protein
VEQYFAKIISYRNILPKVGKLQTPYELGEPLSINDSPCRVRKGLSPSSERALPGAHRKSRSALPSLIGF